MEFAKLKWFNRHGINFFQTDAATAEQAQKLFKFIDYNDDKVVSKH